METFKERCVQLRKEDKSITEIMQLTGKSKSSIYHHIQHIPLSVGRVRKYKNLSGERIKKYALVRKGVSGRRFRTFTQWTPDRVALIGHLLFDGSITKRSCVYNNRSEALVTKVETLMRTLYDYEPKRWRNPRTEVHRISYHNVALSNFLNIQADTLLREVVKLSRACKKAFLGAFFDDEGCADFRPETHRRKVRGYQKDVVRLKLMQKLLSDFDIQAQVILPNEVQITGRENLVKFERSINFSPKIYMNGRRTNSRWKKSLEKRQVLRMAIASFQD